MSGRESEKEKEREGVCYERQSTYFRFCGADRFQVFLATGRLYGSPVQEGWKHVGTEQRLRDSEFVCEYCTRVCVCVWCIRFPLP